MRIIDFSSGLDFRQVDELLAVSEEDDAVERMVLDIIADVRRRGDEAVCEYTRRFDEQELTAATLRVSEDQIHEIASGADDELVDILKRAAHNVREFHQQEACESWEFYAGDGIRLGSRLSALESAGFYIPGGKATYPSSVIMNI